MATVIRLKRMGRKKIPFFRIVVCDERLSAKGGKYVEEIGFYNSKEDKLRIDNEKCNKWLKNGVRISETVKALIKKSGIQIPVSKKKKKEK